MGMGVSPIRAKMRTNERKLVFSQLYSLVKASICKKFFPKNVDRKQKWFEAIGHVVNYSSARICSDHFSKNDFNHDSTERKRLFSTAIPISKENSLTHREINEQTNEDTNCLDQNTNVAATRKRKISNVQIGTCNENVQHKKIYLNLPSNAVATFTRSNFTSDEAWNTFVRSTIYSRQKRRFIMQTCKRLRKRVCNLRSLLKFLGNKRLLANNSIDAIKIK
ncbi:uncharacterized protein LOC117601678 isoform X2 [Osmia lignaria lignaria]|nr:uncharacterized protein LOC117601678 isoform X2 [Osmia lignaria]